MSTAIMRIAPLILLFACERDCPPAPEPTAGLVATTVVLFDDYTPKKTELWSHRIGTSAEHELPECKLVALLERIVVQCPDRDLFMSVPYAGLTQQHPFTFLVKDRMYGIRCE